MVFKQSGVLECLESFCQVELLYTRKLSPDHSAFDDCFEEKVVDGDVRVILINIVEDVFLSIL